MDTARLALNYVVRTCGEQRLGHITTACLKSKDGHTECELTSAKYFITTILFYQFYTLEGSLRLREYKP